MKVELEDVLKVIQKCLDKNNSRMEDMRDEVEHSIEQDKLTAKRIPGFKTSMTTRLNKASHLKYYNRATEVNHLLGEIKKLGQIKEAIKTTVSGPEELYNNDKPWTGD